MLPSDFFIQAKYPDDSTHGHLTLDDEAVLNRIFFELYAEVSSRSNNKKENEKPYLNMSDGLRHAIPSEFFNPPHRQTVQTQRPKRSIARKKEKNSRKTLPADNLNLDEMLVSVFKEDPYKMSDDSPILKTLIKKLHDSGFNVDSDQSKWTLEAFEVVIRQTIESLSSRPASLNCYDYIRLKDEVGRVSELDDSFAETCQQLMRLIKEVDDAENSGEEYPVRHFPFDRIKCKSPWAYQCLRMMDEILYTTPSPIQSVSTDYNVLSPIHTMSGKIADACKKYGIEFQTVSEDALKKYYVTLRNLINVEFTGDFRKTYSNDGVYEYSSSHGHKYAKMRNSEQRVTAFKLCFSLSEARLMQSELQNIIDSQIARGLISGPEEFSKQFPLLNTLADIDKYNPKIALSRNLINSTSGKQTSSLYTLNYLPPEEPEVKMKVKAALIPSNPKAINIPLGEKAGTYLPISLNEQGLSWSLLAQNINNGLLYNLQPKDFGHSLTLSEIDSKQMILAPEENVIGLGDFYFDRKLCNVSITLTESGYKKLNQESDPLYPLVERFERDKSYSSRPKGIAYLSLYINDDFFEELHRLDRNKHIKDIAPQNIKDAYTAFLRRNKRKTCMR